MTIKIYELCGADETHLFSPHCWKTRYSLAHKGLDYNIVPTPFTKVASIEGGPNRTVPVIRDGDVVTHESFEIAKYLDEAYPDAPTLIGGEEAEALTRFVISWSQSQVHPAVVKLCLLDIHNALGPDDQAFFRETREKLFGCTLEEFDAKFPKDAKDINRVLTPLNVMLGQQSFIGGESSMFADYVVFGGLQWMRTCCKSDIKLDGRAGEWFETMLDLYDGLGRSAAAAN